MQFSCQPKTCGLLVDKCKLSRLLLLNSAIESLGSIRGCGYNYNYCIWIACIHSTVFTVVFCVFVVFPGRVPGPQRQFRPLPRLKAEGPTDWLENSSPGVGLWDESKD